jgi:tetratricopeptide (TPR) repeat protein
LEALMATLAKGSVSDRPWGMTLGALGLRGLSGQLTLAGQYRVAFQRGVIIGAFSPLANDAAVRLALTGNLITSSQVADITRRIAAAPARDEVEVLAEACRLAPDQAQRLRRRLVAQRAARTFAIDQGEFVVEDQVTIGVVAGSALDIRTIVFLGAKNNLSEDRLATELAQLGVWFKLKPEASDDIPQFGFSEEERAIVQMLVRGENLTDMLATHASLGARSVRAVTYALASCGAVEMRATPVGQRASMTAPPANVPQSSPPLRPTSGGNPADLKAVGGIHPGLPRGSSDDPTLGRGRTRVPQDGEMDDIPTIMELRTRSGDHSQSTPAVGRVSTEDVTVALPSSREPTNPHATPAAGRVATNPNVRRESTSATSAADVSANPSESATNNSTTPPAAGMPSANRPTPAGVPSPHRMGSGTNRPTNTPAAGVPATNRPTPAAGVPNPSRSGSATNRVPTNPSGTRSDPAIGRAPSDPAVGRVPTPSDAIPAGPRTITQSSGVPRESDSRYSSGARDRSPSGGTGTPNDRSPSGGVSRPHSASSSSNLPAMPARTGKAIARRPKQNTAATMEIEQLLYKKVPLLDQGVDYFTLLGLPIGAPPDDVKNTYFMLARKLHPDRLASIGVDDEDRKAQRLMACLNEAFAVLNDPVRRADYVTVLGRGGEAAVRAEEQAADELAMRVMRAEEAFRLGEMALRREQIDQAVQQFGIAAELQPNEAEYQAMLAWATFAAAPDKNVVAQVTRRALTRAADANDRSPTALFYLGRVERMLGREKEALHYFQEVLRIKPSHSEATSEARILEQRLKARR